MKIMNRLVVGVILVAVLAISTTLVVAITPRIHPTGRIRVSLEGSGAGWNRFVQVHDGSFSAQLDADASNSGGVVVSPLSIPLKTLRASDIRFWVYFYSTTLVYPQIDFILDNGRRMEGSAFGAQSSTTPVSGTVQCEDGSGASPPETCLGFPTAEIWIQMKAQDKWYSSYALADPLIPDEYDIGAINAGDHTIAEWAALTGFENVRIVQMKIAFRAPPAGPTGIEVYIDNITIRGMIINVDPESIVDS